jgi:Lysyl oxidase
VSRSKTAALLTTAALAVGAAVAAAPAHAAPAPAAPAPAPPSAARNAGPELKLIPAQNAITAAGFPVKKNSKQVQVYVDPGIWLASLGSALQLDVGRTSYAKPVTLTQITTRPGYPPLARQLPATMLDGWNGLKDMVALTVRDSAGKVVGSARLTVCPNGYDTERATADSPDSSPYPQSCSPFDPFPVGEVWGIAKGWAIDPAEFTGRPVTPFTLTIGSTYTVTETVTPRYVGWFHLSPRDAAASVKMTVVPQSGPPVPSRSRGRALPALPAVPTLKNPPASVLPDLVPLPAWGMSTTPSGGRDWLNFAATVWIGGNGPLDVEAFRSGGSPVMPAFQYFYRNGKVIGRVRAGTMGFDSAKGHNHWHFQQFAEYQLLGANKKLVVRSQKVGFCIAPTDPVDLLLPHSPWAPQFIGLAGQCGSPTALWVREMLPVGWGDTYEQFLAGQAFDITNLPNGTYYVEVIANPEHLLRETSYGNDVSLRKIIVSGTKGHRHVKVPAFYGMDSEG